MVQTWTDDTFAAGHVAQTDLQNMENNFLSLRSSFSGAAAPGDTVAGKQWFDTAQKVLKVRNEGDDGWYGLMHGDVSEKRLVYRNAAMEGYARDSGVTDKVIALKGGATYVAGAATAGTWTISGLTAANESAHTHNHNHQWHNAIYAAGGTPESYTYDSAGNALVYDDEGFNKGQAGPAGKFGSDSDSRDHVDAYTKKTATAGSAHTHAVSQSGAWRAAAAVCILVYLDL